MHTRQRQLGGAGAPMLGLAILDPTPSMAVAAVEGAIPPTATPTPARTWTKTPTDERRGNTVYVMIIGDVPGPEQ